MSNYCKNCYELTEQLDQLKAELESTKGLVTVGNKQLMEVLKENEELKETNSKLLEYRRHAVTCQECYEDGLEDGKTSNKELRKLKQTLAEIKELLLKTPTSSQEHCVNAKSVILQKISEVEDVNN